MTPSTTTYSIWLVARDTIHYLMLFGVDAAGQYAVDNLVEYNNMDKYTGR